MHCNCTIYKFITIVCAYARASLACSCCICVLLTRCATGKVSQFRLRYQEICAKHVHQRCHWTASTFLAMKPVVTDAMRTNQS